MSPSETTAEQVDTALKRLDELRAHSNQANALITELSAALKVKDQRIADLESGRNENIAQIGKLQAFVAKKDREYEYAASVSRAEIASLHAELNALHTTKPGLRDQFAGIAMGALVGSTGHSFIAAGTPLTPDMYDSFAAISYRMADAMLKTRETK